MGRAPCCEKTGLKRGPWTQEEDQKLIDYIHKHGDGNWKTLPKNAGLARCGKSCRLRWANYLRPDIKRGRFSFEEEETIIQLHSILGNKWSAIAARLPGRTDNEIKNYWNTHIRKRFLHMGIDPVTHGPRLNCLDLSNLLSNPTTMYNAAQYDFSGLLGAESYVNSSELLRIAENLLSPLCQGSESVHQNLQQKPHNTASQFHSTCNPIQELVSSSNASGAQFFTGSHLMAPNLNHLQPSTGEANLRQADGMPCNFIENQAPATTLANNTGYQNLERSLAPQFVTDSSSVYLFDNQNLAVTTPIVSSPVWSLATQLSSSPFTYAKSCIEDDIDSYFSELFKFQIPDSLDVVEHI